MPVKHVSLSWDPSERPSREEMIAAAQSYLDAHGWGHHQCALFAHSDKRHRHVHLMINMVDPERGTRLKDHREFRKAQAWAHDYEKSRGRIFCAEREKPIKEREPSPPRNVWEQLRALQDISRTPEFAVQSAPTINYDRPRKEWQQEEWRALKERQKAERIAFFEHGRLAYRALRQEVYREVRATYRQEWARYYRIMKHGASKEQLIAMRTGLLARQSATLQEKCRAAALELRADRDTFYKDVLRLQKDHRAALAERQSSGLTSPDLLLGPERRSPPGFAPARTREVAAKPHLGPLWTQRAGLVPQQRSARRWLDVAKDRISRGRPKEGPLATSALQREQERLQTDKVDKGKRSGRALEPGGGLEL
ncbi:relaxase/mobilization nuclease domain-containing protein [Bradyrhizobium niftali]|uniref:relaxase/mobilization nuclease domain-containing protein n=1 Tax=Bradyrhizobium niftali TaxID=2560055 RepID=UPI001F37AA06|nr:relaxase/mobilization nuclease domain-containing protein [Bradyrhizobium niftali]